MPHGSRLLGKFPTSGFIWTPNWLLLRNRDEGAPRDGRTRGAVRGIVPIVTTSRHKPISEFKNIDFERSYGHFGLLNKYLYLEALTVQYSILDTGFRYLLAFKWPWLWY